MKYISIKEICLIIITLCIVATTYNRWDIGRFKKDKNYQDDFTIVFDTKTGNQKELKNFIHRKLSDGSTGKAPIYHITNHDKQEIHFVEYQIIEK